MSRAGRSSLSDQAGRKMCVAALMSIVFLAGCGIAPWKSAVPTEAWKLTFMNIDGPPVDVRINGSPLGGGGAPPGTLMCGQSGAIDATTPGLPAFPWTIDVVGSDGANISRFVVDGQGRPLIALVRRDGVVVGPKDMSYGPAPELPCPS
jgi:hypothetical protein